MYCVGIRYILNNNMCKYRLNTCHNTSHNKCQIQRTCVVLYCIAIHPSTYQHGMYCVGICHVWNNDTCQYRPNACLFFQDVPMLMLIHSPIWSQYNPIQTNISPNTDQNKHQYRRIYTTLFSMLAPVYANTGICTVRSGASASTASAGDCAASTASILV